VAKKNFYAVKVGRKIGVFDTWAECKKSIDGFPHAKYQGFATIEEANEFLGIAKKVESKAKKTDKQKKSSSNNKISNNDDLIKPIRSDASVEVFKEYIDYEEIKDKYEFIAFVDGSYDKHSKTYGSGVVVLNLQSNEHKLYSCAGYDKWDQWNIVGELEATKLALKKAKEEYRAKNVAIYHDLKNISLWASGEWQAKNEYTQDYVHLIQEFSLEMNICFIKVKAHSDESIYNDLADKTAKEAIEEYKDRHGIKKSNKNDKSTYNFSITMTDELKNKFDNECISFNISHDEAIKRLIEEWVG
jgi:viroplasmin and RNaseH domain-containing protein